MEGCELLDFTERFFGILAANADRPVDRQIDAWTEHYRREAPELLRKCVDSYEAQGHDWRQAAKEHVWPHIPANVETMQVARRSVGEVYESVYSRSVQALGVDFPIAFVVYVGIGCGAGWATRYRGQPAVLVGLENVAELSWHEPAAMCRLLAHEIGHLYMFRLRGWERRPAGGPLQVLFEEGFAQHAEHLILEGRTWSCCSQEGWLAWCVANEGNLARRYLDEMHDREATRKFFGSWLDIEGWRQTGYFLGCRLVERLGQSQSMEELARLSEKWITAAAREYLESVR